MLIEDIKWIDVLQMEKRCFSGLNFHCVGVKKICLFSFLYTGKHMEAGLDLSKPASILNL